MRAFWDFLKAFTLMFLRNRQALFWTFFFPVLLMGLLGIVFGRGFGGDFNLAIVQQDEGRVAAALVQAFEKADGVHVSRSVTEAAGLKELEDGTVQGVLVLPRGLERSFAEGGVTELPFHYDDSDVATAGQVLSVTQQIVEAVGNGLARVQLPLSIRPQGVKAQSLGYLDFLVPGIVALSIMQTAIFGIAGTIVTYKEKGVLRRLRATPLPMRSFMGSNVTMRVATALIQTAIVLGVGMLLFEVSINGSLLLVAVVAVVGAGAFVSLGFAIAAVSRNQEVAQALMNVVQTPMMFLSGIFFPMNNAPAWIQPVVKAMPLTYLADALRAVILDDVGLWAVRWDLAVLLAVTAVFVVVAWRFFRWE
ncbi:MAG: ABC transporter permease [Thermoleophilia bacterium]